MGAQRKGKDNGRKNAQNAQERSRAGLQIRGPLLCETLSVQVHAMNPHLASRVPPWGH